MASRLSSIVKAITPLVSASSGLVGLLGERRNQNRSLTTDAGQRQREEDMLRLGNVLALAMEQLQATAQELRTQAQLYDSQRARIRLACFFSALALGLSALAVVLAIVR